MNSMTLDQWTLEEQVEACARAGVGWIAPWRHTLTDLGVERSARLIREAGLQVSSLCRGGFFTGPQGELAAREIDNKRAVEEAASLGAAALVLVCGPCFNRDLQGSRDLVVLGLEQLVPYAQEHGVSLAIEPLHPMLIADRSVVVTLGEALDLAERFDSSDVGVVVDVYHVFWDPTVYDQIRRAGKRIRGFHVSDWATPKGDALASRVMMGDGVIDIRSLRVLVEQSGYRGAIEVEVINEDLRLASGDDVLQRAVATFREFV